MGEWKSNPARLNFIFPVWHFLGVKAENMSQGSFHPCLHHWSRLDDGKGVEVCGFRELSSGCCTLFAIQEKKLCHGDIFVKRFFLWPSNQLYRSSKSPPDVRGRCGALLGRAGLPCSENMGFNNISPGSLLPFLQSSLLPHHENS